MTCGKTQEFLAKNKIEIGEAVSTRAKTFTEKDALRMASDADQIYAARGKKVVHYDLKKEKPSKDDLKKIMLGPTGNLRAPTMRIGKTVIIGFDEGVYRELVLK
ncbi:conserved hypothetical protein [Candidatus Zixiibacteriota bacterium]|nr:conserved hypothetical protein [candidate division Zixibacteria bacterium]